MNPTKLVFFTQPTCVPCKQLKPVAEKLTAMYGIKLEYWDVSLDWQRAVNYDVKSTPTLLAMSEDNTEWIRVTATHPIELARDLKEAFNV